MSTFRDRILEKLTEAGIDEDAIARQVGEIVTGTTVVEQYRVSNNLLVLDKVKRTRTPRDMAAGAMIYDRLVGGNLGLAPKQIMTVQAEAKELYARYAPEVDERVIHRIGDQTIKSDNSNGS